MRQSVKWWVAALTLCAVLLTALEVWRGGGSQWERGARRIEVACASRDERVVLAVALLDAQGDVVCSGVTLSSRWAVTAAHCLLGSSPRYAQAAHAPRAVPLAALYPHPRFSYRTPSAWAVREVRALANDVGLVEAREPLEAPPPGLMRRRLSKIAPHQLTFALGHHTLRDLVGKSLVMVGFSQRAWSREPWGSDAAAELTVAAGYTGAVCGSRGPWVTPAPVRHGTRDGLGPPGVQWRGCVCARAPRPLCRGESGAGLFIGNQLVAIASLGPLNCSQPALSVFTIISPYIKSISKTINQRRLYKERDQNFVELRSDHTTSLHPYIEAIRSKTSSDYSEDRIIRTFNYLLKDNKIEFINETYAYQRKNDRSSVDNSVAAVAADDGGHTTRTCTHTRARGGENVSTANQSHAAAENYDTDIYVPGPIV